MSLTAHLHVQAVRAVGNHEIRFVYYAQSNQASSKQDSSVSYAAGVVSQRQ